MLLAASGHSTEAVAQPNPAPDLYYVSIGSQTYLRPSRNTPFRWPLIPAPVNSAGRVAQLLQSSGARYGILLVSDRTHAVSKFDMEQAIADLKTRIRLDNPRHPVIVFYYMGHGLGDPFNQNLYLAPGDMVVDLKPSQTYTNVLTRAALTNQDVITSLEMFRLVPAMSFEDDFFISKLTPDLTSLTDILRVVNYGRGLVRQDNANRAAGLYPPGQTTAIPFIALFDNCYDGVLEDLSKPLRVPLFVQSLPQAAQAFLRDAVALLNGVVAEVHERIIKTSAEAQVDGIVLYATRPGTAVSHFQNSALTGDLPTGSLARRLSLSLAGALPSTRISLEELRRRMLDPSPVALGSGAASPVDAGPTPYTIQVAEAPVLATEIAVGSNESGSAMEKRIGTGDISRSQ